MRFASLGSGSEGNALLVEAGSGANPTRVLIDCGFGLRDTVRRLERLGVAADSLTAILITHEHGDHIGGVVPFASKYQISTWMTYGTQSWLSDRSDRIGKSNGALPLTVFDSHADFTIGDLCIRPLPVPHDAREPVQFIISDGNHRLAVLTDIGVSTPYIEAQVQGCDALVLECNHDLDMLQQSAYPYSLKQRISGRFGHLHNEGAAALLAAIDRSRLQHLIAAHLSQQNNHPDKACAALAAVMGCAPSWITVATQEDGFDWRQL